MDRSETFLATDDSRFEHSHGPLPLGADKVIDKLVCCGDPHYGLTMLHCLECNVHLAVPFSCKTRVCPSCVNRRAECLSQAFAEKLPTGDYRHLVVTLPKKMGLRKRFQLNSRLHRQIGRLVHRVIRRWMASQIGCHRNLVTKIWSHASDFLADWAQHIPRPRQQQVTYAGWFSNALGKLNAKPIRKEAARDDLAEVKPVKKWVRWRTLVLRTWAVDPELCPVCRQQMQRTKALIEWQELQRLLKSLGIAGYPTRPRPPPQPELTSDITPDSQFSDSYSQFPSDWEDWDAA